eukprot:5542849-Amphidinium_carterae.2
MSNASKQSVNDARNHGSTITDDGPALIHNMALQSCQKASRGTTTPRHHESAGSTFCQMCFSAAPRLSHFTIVAYETFPGGACSASVNFNWLPPQAISAPLRPCITSFHALHARSILFVPSYRAEGNHLPIKTKEPVATETSTSSSRTNQLDALSNMSWNTFLGW